jgi:hypothetical protein
VRVSTKDASGNPTAQAATFALKAGPDTVTLTANQPGTWGNHLSIDVDTQVLSNQQAFISEELIAFTGADAFKLRRKIDLSSARNRITLENQGVVTDLKIVNRAPKPGAGEVQIIPATGALVFAAPDKPKSPAIVTASYLTKTSPQQVTIHLDQTSEVYAVADAADLAAQLDNQSAWVTAPVNTTSLKPVTAIPATPPVMFKGGTDGTIPAGSVDYDSGLDALLNVDAHIIVAAGKDQSFGPDLERHCAKASTDALKRDRIAIVGTPLIDPNQADKFFDQLVGHNLTSDRLIFVCPGIQTQDAPTGQTVTLPGAYSAAALAGLISTFDPEISPTNKELAINELETHFDAAHLTAMVQNRILALEARSGFRIVKGITTDDGAFRQITTRRIVDYTKYGVRGAAEPYIGLLNNERVRGALRGTINSFLTDMVNAEMLEGYDLDVSATRDEEIQGICRVTMSLQPVFSIDFIVVDMFLG